MFNLKPKYDILFYYPKHFNRSKQGTNSYFDPLIKTCKDYNLRFLLVEEPDKGTSMPHNPEAIEFDIWFLLILVFRKLIPLKLCGNFQRREILIGRIIGMLSFQRFKARVYITISNSMINLLPGLNIKAKVFDLQHGIIYSTHWGYFEPNGLLVENLRDKRIHFLVYGEGYINSFLRNVENHKFHISEKVKIIGDVIQDNDKVYSVKIRPKTTVLYSLQLTEDVGLASLEIQKNHLLEFIGNISKHFERSKLTLLLKHHPRFNNAIGLDEISERYSFVSYTTASDLSEKVFLHLTQSSTTAFEYAAVGIPTWFVPTINNDCGYKIFIEEYCYPINKDNLDILIDSYINDDGVYLADADKVINWYRKFYSHFDSKNFIEAIG